MFCSRQTNNMINKIHGKALRIVLNDHISDFETMLRNVNGITVHHRNIQTLMIELLKIKFDLAPPIIDSMLNRRTICYNFRNLQEFQLERKRTVFYGLETVFYGLYICLALQEDTFQLGIYKCLLLFDMYLPASTHFINSHFFILLFFLLPR